MADKQTTLQVACTFCNRVVHELEILPSGSVYKPDTVECECGAECGGTIGDGEIMFWGENHEEVVGNDANWPEWAIEAWETR